MNRLLDLTIKLGLVFLTLGIVIYALLASKFWAAETQVWFLQAGDYQTVILISAGVIAFGWTLKQLLHWEIHATLFPKKRRKR